jgi:hypothetical protein
VCRRSGRHSTLISGALRCQLADTRVGERKLAHCTCAVSTPCGGCAVPRPVLHCTRTL